MGGIMGLSLKGLLLSGLLLLSSLAFGDTYSDIQHDDFFQIVSADFEEITPDAELIDNSYLKVTHDNSLANNYNTKIENVGSVIAIGRDLVALGESIYRLVIKGKPTTKTTYAPISVVPKVNGEPADIFETEGWSAPVKRTYEIKYRNLYDVVVVHFQFSVIYSYNGKYNGTGAYLTAVQVIPEYVRTLFGFDFEATMKLGGIQNQGTRNNPIAGATVMIEYVTSSVMNSITRVTSFFITGKGQLKKL